MFFAVEDLMSIFDLEKARIEGERRAEDIARESLTPEDFEAWKAERTAERRHKEMCEAIRAAGNNARPRGGIFSGFH